MGSESILIAMAVMGAVGAMIAKKGSSETVARPERSDINMFSDYGDESLPSEYYGAMAAVERAVKEQNGTTGSTAPIMHRFSGRPTATSTKSAPAAFGRRAH